MQVAEQACLRRRRRALRFSTRRSALTRFALLVLGGLLLTGAECLALQVPRVDLGTPNAEAGHEFAFVTSVRELNDARLLVADRAEQRLAVVDFQGGSVETIGRPGAGPGEYGDAGWLYPLGGDSTLFTDPVSGRWLLLEGGRIVETRTRAGPSVLVGSLLLGADDRGGVLGNRGFLWNSRRRGREMADSLLVLLIERESAAVDTIARIKGRGHEAEFIVSSRGGQPGFGAMNPLASEDQALLFLDGWIALAHAEPYRVDWRSPDGEWVRGPPLPFTPVRVDRDEQHAAMIRAWSRRRADAFRPSDVPGWPDVVPPFLPGISRALLAAPDGRVLVARTFTMASSETRYDVVDRRGQLSATLELPANEMLVGFGRSSAYTVTTDDFGLQRLRRYAWP